MTHEQSDEEHTPPRAASSEPIDPTPNTATSPPPSRLTRLGASWRTSLPLRIATAAVVALLISGVGFAAGTAFGDDDNPHHTPHHVTADHPFWQNHMGWFHRNSD
ncbi:hypothetical protein [Nocardia macrotermitis]|uniref:Uncharacterized protein n=1 Tax=Nocardia macrotermitis TaxID=2585198 RepID=A0A7K0CX19_9NOCA|nr:hypothetical protein [Nocardia macrotermitis]MQY17204.1 hypothetical protein [Nocardia macrotermitis]